MKRIGIQLAKKITIAITLIVCAFGLLVLYYQYIEYNNFFNHKTARIVQQLSSLLSKPVWEMNKNHIDDIVLSFLNDEDILVIKVSDIKRIISYWGKDQITCNPIPLIQPPHFSDDDHIVSHHATIYYNTSLVGSLDITFSRWMIGDHIKHIILYNSLFFIGLIVFLTFIIVSMIKRDISIQKQNELTIKKMNTDLEKLVNERTEELAQAMNALWGEMELANRIQATLIPKHPKFNGYEIAASIDPAFKVGGDFYDTLTINGMNWIIMGDASGHGVSSGLMMMMVQTSIRTILNDNPMISPDSLLVSVNKTIYQNLHSMKETAHMTIVAVVEKENGRFLFAGMHEDILIWRHDSKTIEQIETNGIWIGLEPDISNQLPVSSFDLQPEDCLILYTDGITEAVDDHEQMFGIKRLLATIENFDCNNAFAIHDHIINALYGYNKYDDISLFVMKKMPTY